MLSDNLNGSHTEARNIQIYNKIYKVSFQHIGKSCCTLAGVCLSRIHVDATTQQNTIQLNMQYRLKRETNNLLQN